MAKASRVELNRAAMGEVLTAAGDGLLELADAMLENVSPPDQPPYGKGLIKHGGTAVWVLGKKTGGNGSKPRALRLDKAGITAIVGYGFPARLNEMGSIHQPGRPFLTPGVMREVPNAEVHVARGTQRRLDASRMNLR